VLEGAINQESIAKQNVGTTSSLENPKDHTSSLSLYITLLLCINSLDVLLYWIALLFLRANSKKLQKNLGNYFSAERDGRS
jgi:hypothetical protein